MSDEEVQAAVMTRIRRLYPNEEVPDPVAFYMTRWGLDPLAYGCYSTFYPGFKDGSFRTLTTPISDTKGRDRVYLAGEAYCDDISGTTYGAHQSGKQTAQTYLWKTKRRAFKPKDICYA